MREGWGGLLGVGLLSLFLASAAHADLLRCVGPDGKTIYTDSKAQCPGAKPFEPQGVLQPGGPTRPPVPASEGALADRLHRANARRLAGEVEEQEAQRWRDRKSEIEAILAKLQARRDYLEQFITLCNRGGSVMARDASGIKRTVRCTKIKSQYADLEKEEVSANERLAALPEECRRAGCLPGWIR